MKQNPGKVCGKCERCEQVQKTLGQTVKPIEFHWLVGWESCCSFFFVPPLGQFFFMAILFDFGWLIK